MAHDDGGGDESDRRRARSASHLDDTRRTLAVLDRDYACAGCLGVGGFGSVFLAKKRGSGRRVALKVLPMDTSDDESYEGFTRELSAVVELNERSDDGDGSRKDRDLGIVYFEDWHIARNFAAIVMQYADGGTLAQEIGRREGRRPFVPYAERRIAWYALQMCDALAFAHEKGVAHHDVKAANILIDASAGGKLLLADFGTALKPGEEAVGFTRSYASPELLASHELEDYSDIRADAVDAFALGCVIYELLACRTLEDMSADQTLAQFVADGPGLEAALTLEQLRLPWLPLDESPPPYVGYTQALKSLVSNLLRPNVNERLLPSQLQDALRSDPLSPLLLPKVSAAEPATPGAPLTIDNVQLGMLCQRGPDWTDGFADGGKDCIGVVVRLDGDGTYVDAAFPSRGSGPVEAACYRMGANNKFELRAGPSPLSDYVAGTTAPRHDGVVRAGAAGTSGASAGQRLNSDCMVVGADESRGILFAAPMKPMPTPTLPAPTAWKTEGSSFATHEERTPRPDTWQLDLGKFVDVLDEEERNRVLDLFYARAGGLKRGECPVQAIQRIQDPWLWDSYTRGRQKVLNENWGIENEVRAFVVSPEELNDTNLPNFQSMGRQFSTKASVVHYKFNKRPGMARTQMLLCRVAVGRVREGGGKAPPARPGPAPSCHSEAVSRDLFACLGTCLAYPEYVITYRDNSPPVAVADRDLGSPRLRGRSESKMCAICMERPVRYLIIPCGHPCLCERCNGYQTRKKLKGRCPECRAEFRHTAVIYGRVVNDE